MNSKKFIKSAFSILLALSVVCTSNVVYASDNQSANSSNESEYVSIGEKLESLLPEKKEEVKEITNIEELDTKVLNNDSDSAFKSCRLIIYSDKDMEFKDIKGRNNIKKVQKLDKMYIVEYASVKDTEDAYNFYTSLGVEVEIDVVNNTPEGVENKDSENKDVRNEEIAKTNDKDKPTESIETVKKNDNEDKSIVVAVLDSGLNNGDEIFDDKLVEGKNFVDENSDKTDDVYGHGTTMARVVLDTTNDSNIKIMPIKVLNDEGKGTTLSAYKGIKCAIEKNVDVINLSMSGIGHSKLLESAINEAVNHNIPVVVSAGNDNKEITEYTPANIESAITVSSAYENVLEDGKVEYLKSFYSNYGSDTNNINFATNSHFEYKRNINNKEVTTKVEGTSISASYVTSFIAMLKVMALTDEDTSNDKLSFNDVYASLSESAIKQEDTKIFGEGFLKKDNFKLIKSEKEEETFPIENVDNVTEDVTLNANVEAEYACGIKYENGQYHYFTGSGVRPLDGQCPSGAWAMLAILKHMDDNVPRNTGSVTNSIRLDLYTDVIVDVGESLGIESNKNLTISAGSNATRLILTGTGARSRSDFFWGSNSETAGLTLRNITLISQTTSVDDFSGASSVSSSGGPLTVDRCVIQNSGNSWWVIGNSRMNFETNRLADISITNSTFRNTGDAKGAMALITNGNTQDDQRCEVTNCRFEDIPSRTMTIYNRGSSSGKIKVSNCTFTRCGGFNAAVGISNISGDATIRDCTFTGLNSRTGNEAEVGQSLIAHEADIGGSITDGTLNVINCNLSGSGSSKGVGVYNNKGTVNISGNTRISSNKYGVKCWGYQTSFAENWYNNKLYSPTVSSNGIGVLVGFGSSYPIFNMGAGTISNNYGYGNDHGYGIENHGVVNHSGGNIYHNYGGRAVDGDITDVGVYQNNTYNISGDAKVYDNAIYLANDTRVVNQFNPSKRDNTFNGSAIITTASNDRTIGKKLVTNSSSGDSTKYTLAYGDTNGKTRAKYVKNDNKSDFTGSEVGIRYGGNIKKTGITSTSQYLSGNYAVKYEVTKPSGCSPNPQSFPSTTFWWREAVTALCGSNKPTDTNNKYEFEGWADTAGKVYNTNQTFNIPSTVLNDNKVYKSKWKGEPIAQEYPITYIMQGGTNNPNNPTTYQVNQSILIYPANKENNKFTGWTCNKPIKIKGNTYKAYTNLGTSFVVDPGDYGPLTFTAQWEESGSTGDWSYNIIWDSNGNWNDGRNDKEKLNYSHSYYNKYRYYTEESDKDGKPHKKWHTETTHYQGELGTYEVPDTPKTATLYFDDPNAHGNTSNISTSIKTQKRFDGWKKIRTTGTRTPTKTIWKNSEGEYEKEYHETKYRADSPWKSPGKFRDMTDAGKTTTLQAQWTRLPTKLPGVSKPGYDFLGWQINGTGRIYREGEEYTVGADDNDVTFVAVWRRNQGKVVYNPNGAVDDNNQQYGTVTDDSYTMLNGSYTTKDGDIFGKEVTEDGFIKNETTKNKVGTTITNKYIINDGDIINTLGTTDKLSTFQGWSSINYARHDTPNILYNGYVSKFMNIYYDVTAVNKLKFTNPPNPYTINNVKTRANQIVTHRNNNISKWKTTPRLSEIGEWFEKLTTSKLYYDPSLEGNGLVNMYATWDEFPAFTQVDDVSILSSDLEKQDIFETDAQIQKRIETRIMRDIVVTDKEYGKDKQGTLPYGQLPHITGDDKGKGKVGIEVIDLDMDAIKQISQGMTGGILVTIQATDSVGHITKTQVMLYINQVKSEEDLTGEVKDNYTRFINKDSYKATYENGGVYKKSKWQNPDTNKYGVREYYNELMSSFNNLENDTYLQKYGFNHEDVLDTQKYVGIIDGDGKDSKVNVKYRNIGKNGKDGEQNLINYYNRVQSKRLDK